MIRHNVCSLSIRCRKWYVRIPVWFDELTELKADVHRKDSQGSNQAMNIDTPPTSARSNISNASTGISLHSQFENDVF